MVHWRTSSVAKLARSSEVSFRLHAVPREYSLHALGRSSLRVLLRFASEEDDRRELLAYALARQRIAERSLHVQSYRMLLVYRPGSGNDRVLEQCECDGANQVVRCLQVHSISRSSITKIHHFTKL